MLGHSTVKGGGGAPQPESRVLELKDKDGTWATAPLNEALDQSVLISDVTLPRFLYGAAERSAWAEFALRLTGTSSTDHYRLNLDLRAKNVGDAQSAGLRAFLADTTSTQGMGCTGIPEDKKLVSFGKDKYSNDFETMFSDLELAANQEVRLCMNFTNNSPGAYESSSGMDYFYKFQAKPMNGNG